MNDSRKISYQSLKEKLSDEKLKRIIAGSGGSSYAALIQTGTINGCNWSRADCWCTVDILVDDGTQHCGIPAPYIACEEGCSPYVLPCYLNT